MYVPFFFLAPSSPSPSAAPLLRGRVVAPVVIPVQLSETPAVLSCTHAGPRKIRESLLSLVKKGLTVRVVLHSWPFRDLVPRVSSVSLLFLWLRFSALVCRRVRRPGGCPHSVSFLAFSFLVFSFPWWRFSYLRGAEEEQRTEGWRSGGGGGRGRERCRNRGETTGKRVNQEDTRAHGKPEETPRRTDQRTTTQTEGGRQSR